jgi:hypothetical protein
MKLLLEKWEAYLEEGKADDIVAKYPNLKPALDAGIKKPQLLNWMAKRLGDTPIEDAIDAVKEFDKSKAALKAKKKNPDIYGYKTVQDLKDVVQAIGPSRSEKDAKLEKQRILVGEFGDWKVEMPLTTASACRIGKGTTWCTAATETKNLFMSYAEKGIILFHLTKRGENPKVNPDAKLSVGFKEGKPVLGGDFGGVTVNAQNTGLNAKSLKTILGNQFDPIMKAMQAESDKQGGFHPAAAEKAKRVKKQKEELLNAAERAARDPELNKELYEKTRTVDIEPDTKREYFEKLFAFEPVPEVIDFYVELALGRGPGAGIQSDRAVELLTSVARPDAIDRIFVKAKEMNKEIFASFAVLLARSPYIHGEALARLTEIPVFNEPGFEGQRVRYNVLSNDKLPLEIALKFLDKYVAIPQQPRQKGEAYKKQAEAQSMIRYMASRKDLPAEMLEKLATTSNDTEVLTDVAMNVNTPPRTLRILAKERDFAIKLAVAKNPSSPISALITVLKTAKTEFPDDTGRDNRRRQRLADAVQNNPNYTIAGRVKAGASDLLRRLVKEELKAVLREKGIKNS